MSLKVQFLRCIFVVILYLITCTILMKVKSNFYKNNLITKEIRVKYNAQKSIDFERRANVKVLNSEINVLSKNELKSVPIDLQEMVIALQRVSKTCEQYHLNTPIVETHFLYNSKHKSLYCWIRKVASTSFTKLFMDMGDSDIMIPTYLNELLSQSNATNIFKFLLVRHPFERLVSSYRDRLEDNTKYTAQAWIYARQILSITRPMLFYSNTTIGNSLKRIFNSERRLKIVPTFEEFIKYLLKSSEYDVHWNFYYKHCSLCNINYNFILKLDDYTLGQINYILSKINLGKSTVYLSHLKKNQNGYTNFDKTCKYFETLSQEDVLKLYEKYKIDFEMFDYNLSRYIQCAKVK